MNSASRVLAVIAMGGGVAGAAVAIAQVPAPQSAATVAVSGASDTEAVQQLTDQSAQLDAAIASAQARLAQLGASTVTPSASPDLAALLAQTQSQLAIARQRVAVDEALLAKLHAAGHTQRPSAAAPTQAHPSTHPAPSAAASTSPEVERSAASTPTATTPAWQPTQSPLSSPSWRPTHGGGDD